MLLIGSLSGKEEFLADPLLEDLRNSSKRVPMCL
jgi:hypothetical protein